MGKTKTEFLGVVSPVPKGDWQNNVAYKILNLVRYNTASYIAKKDVPPNIIPTNEEYWQLIAYDSFKDKDFKTINGQTIIGEGNIEIEGGGEAITVDDQLSSTSTNPVQNKVVNQAIESAKTEAKDWGTAEATAVRNEAKVYTDQKFNGANKAVAFDNYQDMITTLNAIIDEETAVKTYRPGQNIYIRTLNVPDLWIYDITQIRLDYTYTTDEAFMHDLKVDNTVRVGWFILAALETQKVDLTDYAKTEYVDEKVQLAYVTIERAANDYTDEKIGDISTALDELHTYAQSLINGGVSQ